MDTQDNTFFAAISQFKSHDFEESTNQEMMMLRSLIEDVEATEPNAAPPLPAAAVSHQQQVQAPPPQHPQKQLSVSSQQLASMPNPFSQQAKVPSFAGFMASSNARDLALSAAMQPIPSPLSYIHPSISNSSRFSLSGQQSFSDGLFPTAEHTFDYQQQYFAPYPHHYQAPSSSSSSSQVAPLHMKSTDEINIRSNAARVAPQSCSPLSSAKRIKLNGDGGLSTPTISGPQLTEIPVVMESDRSRTTSSRRLGEKHHHSDEESTTPGDSDNEAKQKKGGSVERFPASIHGETRLNIKFINKGRVGPIPQRFGKSGCIIPDGLSGTHQMYEQRWRFEIKHEMQNNMVLIRWTIHNLTSGKTTSVIETTQDALNRDSCGRTICNNVLKNALEARAQEIEEEIAIKYKDNPSRTSNMRNMVKALRPKRCTVGLLFFGLLHEQIQILMKQQEREMKEST